MDKEIFRVYAEEEWGNGPKTAIDFSPEILKKCSNQYEKAVHILTGSKLKEFQKEYIS